MIEFGPKFYSRIPETLRICCKNFTTTTLSVPRNITNKQTNQRREKQHRGDGQDNNSNNIVNSAK